MDPEAMILFGVIIRRLSIGSRVDREESKSAPSVGWKWAR